MRRIAFIGATLAMSTSLAGADLIIDEAAGTILDVTASTGTGASTAYFVFDFQYTDGLSWALAYQFDGDATAQDALLAFMDIGLTYTFDDYGEWGIFASNFGWGPDIGDAANYWAHSWAQPQGDGNVDWAGAMTSVDTTTLSDGFVSGWYNGFTDDYQAIPPTLPITVVPAPGALLLAGLAAGLRRRRRH